MTTKRLTAIALRDLLDSGLHFGHQTKRWNPKMKRYIFDKRNGIHIIDLTQTVGLVEEAAHFLQETVTGGKRILFVATKKPAQEVIRQAAESCGQFYVTQRWLGGTLTNNATIRRSVRRMRQIEAIARNNNGQLSVHKKEAASLRRELDKLQANLSGIADMEQLPGAMVVVDVTREAIAIAEARRLNIPVVAIVDTNADPDLVDYVIPGNDDAIRAVKLVIDSLAEVARGAVDAHRKLAAEKTRQLEAERAAAAAAAQARKAKAAQQEPPAADAGARARAAEQRRVAARAARQAVDTHAAAAVAANKKPDEASAEQKAANKESDEAKAEQKAEAPAPAASAPASPTPASPETAAPETATPAAKSDDQEQEPVRIAKKAAPAPTPDPEPADADEAEATSGEPDDKAKPAKPKRATATKTKKTKDESGETAADKPQKKSAGAEASGADSTPDDAVASESA